MFLRKKYLTIQIVIIGLILSLSLCKVDNNQFTTQQDGVVIGDDGYTVEENDVEVFIPEEIEESITLTEKDMEALQDDPQETDTNNQYIDTENLDENELVEKYEALNLEEYNKAVIDAESKEDITEEDSSEDIKSK